MAPSQVSALLQRFALLGEADQWAAYGSITEYFREHRAGFVPDPELAARIEARDVMARVAQSVGTDPLRLKIREFDGAPGAVREGWTSRRIIGVFGKWRIAQLSFLNERPRETTLQQLLRRAAGATRLRSDDRVGSITEWLQTDPRMIDERLYDDWTDEERVSGRDGGFHHPKAKTIRTQLGLSWKVLVQVAAGELQPEDAARRQKTIRRARCGGDHDLVSSSDIADMSGRDRGTIQYWMSRDARFPTPVLTTGQRRFYLREDVEAFLDQRPVPQRERDELLSVYTDRAGAAAIARMTPRSFEMTPDRPPPIAQVGGVNLWLRADVEHWARTRQPRRCDAPGCNTVLPEGSHRNRKYCTTRCRNAVNAAATG